MAVVVLGLVVWSLVGANSRAAEGVRFEVSIDQYDAALDRQVMLFRDTFDLIVEVPTTGFLLNMSLDVTVNSIDSLGVGFDLHVYTLNETQSNFAQRFRTEYGLPARLFDIAGKNGASYRLTMLPIEAVPVDTTYCDFLIYRQGDFSVDPSANVNIHYVPNTLADYFWNSVAGMMNDEYELFKKMNSFTLPGRYELFLCPCLSPGILWDGRFSMLADPVKRNLYAVYAEEFNSAYPFLVNHAAILRHYGYSPPFLSEGYANYHSFAIYDMKNLLAEREVPALENFLTTSTYFESDPHTADRVSATFVRYLIDEYGVDRFLDLYRRADDLTLAMTLTAVYGKQVRELEQEWLTYADTVQINFAMASKYCDQAETMRYYELAKEYGSVMLDAAGTKADSLAAYTSLVRGCYFTGDYYGAIDWQQRLLRLDKSSSTAWLGLAAYEMMSGEYDSAAVHLDQALALDSANYFAIFNQGLLAMVTGDTLTARQQFSSIVNDRSIRTAALESYIFLGFLLKHTQDEGAQSRASQLFAEVIESLRTVGPGQRTNAQRPMWLGAAFLGQDDTGNAVEALRLARFLDSRPFNRGMVELWLGKTADIRGEPEVAREHYGNVISTASAYYHQEEARRYLENPYQQ